MPHENTSPTAHTPGATFDSTAWPVPADIHSQFDHLAQTTPHAQKEQGFTGRLTPRPSFMENLANSRDSQFHLDRRDSSELERYFVSIDPGGPCGGESDSPELTIISTIAWTPEYGKALEMADLHAYAWQCLAEIDLAPSGGGWLVHGHYLYFSLWT